MAGDSWLVVTITGEERLVELVVVVTTGLAMVATAETGGVEGGVILIWEGRMSPFLRGIGKTDLAAEPNLQPDHVQETLAWLLSQLDVWQLFADHEQLWQGHDDGGHGQLHGDVDDE